GDDGVWVAESARNAVARLDPADGRLLLQIPVGSGPSALAVTGQGVWVANGLDSTVSLIDPSSNGTVETRAVPGIPDAITAASGGGVWVGALDRNTLTDVRAARAVTVTRLGAAVTALLPGGGAPFVGL